MSAKIATKLVAAMKSIDAVEKRGRNTQQNYGYVKATDVANEVRKALIDAGIAFTYSVQSERYWESQTKSGTTQFFCSLMVACVFTDAESGESASFQCIGWGADSQEKAPYKAMTGALKYALRMNFLIPDESDPEESVTHESVPSHGQLGQPQGHAPAEHRPAAHVQPIRTAPRGAAISEAQSKRFFAMAKQGGKSNDEIRKYLIDVCKCERSVEMPRDKYEAACAWAEAVRTPIDDTSNYNNPFITDDDIPF